MGPIEKLDPNFKAPALAEREGLVYRDCLQPPFSLYGLLPPGEAEGHFLRMPQAAAARLNTQIQELNCHTAGGRLRFMTDSPKIAVRARLHAIGRMAHFTLCGSAGFDLYVREGKEQRYVGTFIPPYTMQDSYEALLSLPKPEEAGALRASGTRPAPTEATAETTLRASGTRPAPTEATAETTLRASGTRPAPTEATAETTLRASGTRSAPTEATAETTLRASGTRPAPTEAAAETTLREFTLHFPLYSGVSSLQVGLVPGAALLPAEGYRYACPVVYYGSSITQGGCASRPGNAYPAILSRMLDCDFVNLGFSGNAKGETEMADYIAGLPMSVFVYDYDHNADTSRLQRTHARMFGIIRERQPQLPVIMLSRPQPYLDEGERARRRIIEETFQSALRAGDKNVYFIDGSSLLHRFGGDSGTVDRCHPNDLGFMCMADGIRETLQRALESAGTGC